MHSIQHYLNQDLLGLCQHALQLETLNQQVLALLPESMQSHCFVGAFNKGALLLMVDSPAWASQLRYLVPELRDKLRSDGGLYQLTAIKIVIVTEKPPQEKPSLKKTIPLSTKARQAINDASQQCQDEALKQALFSLARK
jgi:hypothetical protein